MLCDGGLALRAPTEIDEDMRCFRSSLRCGRLHAETNEDKGLLHGEIAGSRFIQKLNNRTGK